jgi:FkbM family methyltransferase
MMVPSPANDHDGLDGGSQEIADGENTLPKVRVHMHKIAIGSESGKELMWHHVNHGFSSSLLCSTDTNDRLFPQTRLRRQVEVPVGTLDEIFITELDTGLGRLLVKLDVQGFEKRVIAGGRKILIFGGYHYFGDFSSPTI